MSRFKTALCPLERTASFNFVSFTSSFRKQTSSTRLLTFKRSPRCRHSANQFQSYATVTSWKPTSPSFLTIPHSSTSTRKGLSFRPPTLSQIQSNLPKPKIPTIPRLRTGTVMCVDTMDKTVQISFDYQDYDRRFGLVAQCSSNVRAHEPTGYLRAGDVVEFARFTVLTMTERFHRGTLDRRSSGVRYEVHRVITPFGEPVDERPELSGKQELWENLGIVEFQRRKAEIRRTWNNEPKRQAQILEGMCEAIGMEVKWMQKQLEIKPKITPEGSSTKRNRRFRKVM